MLGFENQEIFSLNFSNERWSVSLQLFVLFNRIKVKLKVIEAQAFTDFVKCLLLIFTFDDRENIDIAGNSISASSV